GGGEASRHSLPRIGRMLEASTSHRLAAFMNANSQFVATHTASAPSPSASREERVPATRTEHDRMANAIRVLAMDAVEQAKSGHPGLPMGAADIATVLFTRFLKFD